MADTTLQAIQNKVRRLTRSPSTAQLPIADLDEYINTFVLYDFPEHLRLFTLHTNLSFYTEPNIDTYETNTTDVNHPLYNFKNKYITVNEPIYVAGYRVFFSQAQEQFYNIYPYTNSVASTGLTGDGIITAFAGTLNNIPVLQNKVTFTSIDANNNGLVLVDIPDNGATGTLYVPNDTSIAYGTINYLTGVYSFNFPVAPGASEEVFSQTFPYVASKPQAILYFENKFIVRPVPDKSYKVDLEAFTRPTELLSTGQSPELEQWWQYIAYGAAKKVFEDRMDLESVQMLMPEFRQQETLILRRTIVQQTNERTATIYTNAAETGYRGSNNGGYGNF